MPYVQITTLLYKDSYELISIFSKGIVLDTNMLILYLVGSFDRRYKQNFLEKFNYNENDFTALIRFIERVKIPKFFITPYVLAEFYSRTKIKIKNNLWERFLDWCIPTLLKYDEVFIGKNEIMLHRTFKKYGFCDIGIKLAYQKEECTAILTGDRGLHGVCKKEDMMCIPFEEIKAFYDSAK